MKIEKNIELQKISQYKKYPFKKMEIGDSFQTDLKRERVAKAAYIYGLRNDKKFATRKLPSGCRCWRIL